MEQQVAEADRILIVASPAYRQRAGHEADPGVGRGVQYEARLIRDLFYRNQSDLGRFLPVVLPGGSLDDVPEFLTPSVATVYRVSAFTVTGARNATARAARPARGGRGRPLGPFLDLPTRGHTFSAAATVSLVERCFVGVTVERFSTRVTRQQVLIQKELDRMLSEAAEAAGLPRARWERQPSGGGGVAVLPANIDLVALVGTFTVELDRRLVEHNKDHDLGAHIRLRVAMHNRPRNARRVRLRRSGARAAESPACEMDAAATGALKMPRTRAWCSASELRTAGGAAQLGGPRAEAGGRTGPCPGEGFRQYAYLCVFPTAVRSRACPHRPVRYSPASSRTRPSPGPRHSHRRWNRTLRGGAAGVGCPRARGRRARSARPRRRGPGGQAHHTGAAGTGGTRRVPAPGRCGEDPRRAACRTGRWVGERLRWLGGAFARSAHGSPHLCCRDDGRYGTSAGRSVGGPGSTTSCRFMLNSFAMPKMARHPSILP